MFSLPAVGKGLLTNLPLYCKEIMQLELTNYLGTGKLNNW